MKKYGSCLCHAVRYEVEGEFEGFFLCHCEYCQKDTGSAHAANLFSATASLKWLSGEEQVKVFTLPSTQHTKSFCTICGSALPSVQSVGLVVPAGSLDTKITIKPTAHIYLADKAEWEEGVEQVVRFEYLPS